MTAFRTRAVRPVFRDDHASSPTVLRPGQTRLPLPGRRSESTLRSGAAAGRRLRSASSRPVVIRTRSRHVWVAPAATGLVAAMRRIQGERLAASDRPISGTRTSLVPRVRERADTQQHIAVRANRSARVLPRARRDFTPVTRITTHKVHSQGVVVALGIDPTVLMRHVRVSRQRRRDRAAPSVAAHAVSHVNRRRQQCRRADRRGGAAMISVDGNRVGSDRHSLVVPASELTRGGPGVRLGKVVSGHCICAASTRQHRRYGFSAYGKLVTAAAVLQTGASLASGPGAVFRKRPRPWFPVAPTNLACRGRVSASSPCTMSPHGGRSRSRTASLNHQPLRSAARRSRSAARRWLLRQSKTTSVSSSGGCASSAYRPGHGFRAASDGSKAP